MSIFLFTLMVIGFTNALEFPTAYYAEGAIYLPYGDIAEPFSAWVDMDTGNSRFDSYNGTAKVINCKNKASYGVAYKIVPTTFNNTNQVTCFQTAGAEKAPVVPQGILPNMSLYKYAEDTQYKGMEVSIYLSSFVEGDKVNNYSLLVRKDNSHPVLLHFVGFDRLFGSHYDEYDILYNSFVVGAPDPSVFDYASRYKCVGLSGLGAKHPMSENPIFEMVGAQNYDHSEKQSRHSDEFDLFSFTYNKNYKDHKERSKRSANFNNNLRYINSFNRQNQAFKLAVNHMADFSEDDFKTLRGVRKTKDSLRHDIATDISKTAVPTSWDWWFRGAVTPVKDQGICGSCWSFGTTGTLEGSYFIKHKKLISLSEQCLVDCSWSFNNYGCDGGESETAYEWIMKSGCLPTEDSYGQYLMQDGVCHVDQSVCGVEISNWYNTPQGNVSALVEAIYYHGPISVAIDASHLSFSFYSNGVYYEPTCGNSPDDLDHQVLAVGYGVYDDGSAYILVKNSWSTHWGNDGYILMSQKNNNCGIATDASYADVM